MKNYKYCWKIYANDAIWFVYPDMDLIEFLEKELSISNGVFQPLISRTATYHNMNDVIIYNQDILLHKLWSGKKINGYEFLGEEKLLINSKSKLPKRINNWSFYLPLQFREEIIGDLCELAHEMEKEGQSKFRIKRCLYFHFFFAFFYSFKERSFFRRKSKETAKEENRKIAK